MSNLISLLQWRYATKKFDPSQKVPADKLARILEAMPGNRANAGENGRKKTNRERLVFQIVVEPGGIEPPSVSHQQVDLHV